MIMTDEAFYKLARPLMRGVKIHIRNPLSDAIKNRMVRDMIQDLPAFVGEIVVGKPEDPECRERSEFFLGEETLMHPFIFWVYDMKTTENYGLQDRLQIAEPMVVGACGPFIQFVDHELVTNKTELDAYVEKAVKLGNFPGIVLREPYGTFGTYDDEIPAESLGLQLQ
jgi:hypothetical protein